MLKEIITQQDEKCEECGNEIPKGSRAYVNDHGAELGFLYCLDCVAEELGSE
ncbi:MAG: hypothetical protein ACP5N7_00440 [Candidatus Pacearchaeota archaeon]